MGAIRRGRAAAARAVSGAALALLLGGCGGIQGGSLGDILQRGPLDESTIIAGLREAIQVGTERTVQATSRRDGFFGNPRIRIPVPRELESVAGTLRSVGLGDHVDEFELAMNRAAEEASAEAIGVFGAALRSLTWTDARGILEGDDTAATEFFRARTGAELRERFEPIVTRKMSELGYVRTYDRLVEAYTALPLTTKPAFDPEDYVTDRALDGLFTILGEEEKRIREDPMARTTVLLRRVFGSAAAG